MNEEITRIKQTALVGLKGVHVLVEEMDPQPERMGLSKAQIQTDVELRLRKGGVMVLTKEEMQETPGMPYLYLDVDTFFNSDIHLVAFSIRVELHESVTLARGFKTVGAIWETHSIGDVGKDNIREIRNSIGDKVDKFINDYLAANPK